MKLQEKAEQYKECIIVYNGSNFSISISSYTNEDDEVVSVPIGKDGKKKVFKFGMANRVYKPLSQEELEFFKGHPFCSREAVDLDDKGLQKGYSKETILSIVNSYEDKKKDMERVDDSFAMFSFIHALRSNSIEKLVDFCAVLTGGCPFAVVKNSVDEVTYACAKAYEVNSARFNEVKEMQSLDLITDIALFERAIVHGVLKIDNGDAYSYKGDLVGSTRRSALTMFKENQSLKSSVRQAVREAILGNKRIAGNLLVAECFPPEKVDEGILNKKK